MEKSKKREIGTHSTIGEKNTEREHTTNGHFIIPKEKENN